MIEIIKNPVLIGLTFGVLVYIYMKWNDNKENKRNQEFKETNLFIPLGVGILSWFIAHNYFENYNFSNSNNVSPSNFDNINNQNNLLHTIKPQITQNPILNNIGNSVENVIKNNSDKINLINKPNLQILKKGIQIPNNLNIPDMLLDNF